MVINVKISLCKITAASKLFQRNYYLPLLKPLSPKDALRRKIITGQNILGARIEHYIPVLTTQDDKSAERKRRGKGVPVIKKRIKKHENQRYVEPFLDDNMDNHHLLQRLFHRKSKGKGQYYTYEVPDKNCTLVVPAQMERALKDRDIIDITIAQRSEKILVKLSSGVRVTVPIASYAGEGPLYRGSGWTKEIAEEEHHHGKETMQIAKLFEAKESGVEEWELEMMRMANKRKKKVKGEDSGDWKQMMAGCLDNMDWDKFEEDTKQIVEEVDQLVEEENIPMAVDDMEKTTNVAEKLKLGGSEVLSQLPTMKEIPDVIRNIEAGDMCELLNVSGARVAIPGGRTCFVTGQMVKTDDNEVFVPGQTVYDEGAETKEYVPGITILMDDEPTLIPGLVMGEEDKSAMFLPGESTITQDGQLKFEARDEDLPPARRRPRTPSPSPPPKPRPRPKLQEEEIVIKRRTFDEPEEPRKERVKKKFEMKVKEPSPPREVFRPQRQPLDDPLLLLEEERRRREEEERKRQKERKEEKILKEETKVDKLRMTIRKQCKEFKVVKPAPFVPIEPVKKSAKLLELEEKVKKGTFFEDDKTKEILEKARSSTRMMKYQHVLNAYTSEFGRMRF